MESRQQQLLALMREQQALGTILLAPEGVNGTISGSDQAMQALIAALEEIPGCAPLTCKFSEHHEAPFGKAKVKLKKELISIGEPASPVEAVGEYIPPENWNTFLARPDVVLVDARNTYETHVGKFRGALDPGTRTFKQLVRYSREHLAEWKHKKIATYCTGGIRCEKYTSWLIAQGLEQVYHLEGGILNYLEKVPADKSLFEGACYVFDERTALTHDLSADAAVEECPACGHSLLPEDRHDAEYIAGSHCRYCTGYAPSNADYLAA